MDPQQPQPQSQQPPQLESQPQNTKIISTAIVVLLVLGVGYILLAKFNVPRKDNGEISNDGNGDQGLVEMVENAPVVDGVISVPAGFPQDIPIEKAGIIESNTTNYPDQNAKQLSLSYKSSKTITQKYAEYKTYLVQAGYNLTEGGANTPVRAIFGTKADANLSVAISSSGGKTLVQLSYLLK